MGQNKNSPAYIKKTIGRHLNKNTMPMQKHPTTATECNGTKSKLNTVHTFYLKLYSPERIDINSMDDMLNHITGLDTQEESNQITDDNLLSGILDGTRSSSSLVARVWVDSHITIRLGIFSK